MQTKRKKAPGWDHQPGADRHDWQSAPAGRLASRAGRNESDKSSGSLARRPKRLGQQIFTRNSSKIRHFRKMLHRDGFPLTDRTRAFPDACSKATEATTFSFEIFGELVHADKLSGAEISVKLIYSAALHRKTFRFGGVCRP